MPQARTLFILGTLAIVAYVGLKYRAKRKESLSKNEESARSGKQDNEEQEESWLNLQTLQATGDDFINTVFNSNSLSDAWNNVKWPELPSLEQVNAKLTELYPAFTLQIENLRKSDESFWEYLYMDEFQKIIQETRREDQDPSLHPEINVDAYVRQSSDLCDEEQEFIKKRKQHVRDAFAAFIGVDPEIVDLEDIPIVGIASSGGGYRAMVASTGYMKAMRETGALDCVTYTAGVSGSTWGMAQFYSGLADASFDTLMDHLKSHIHTHIANLSNFITILRASTHNAKILLQGIIQRYYQLKGTLNLVDIFGMLLGFTLLTRKVTVSEGTGTNERGMESYSEKIDRDTSSMEEKDGKIKDDDGAQVLPVILERSELKLSRQKEYFEDGSLPIPIYCVVRHEVREPKATVENEANAIESSKKEEEEPSDFYQWFEFTPYTMGSEEINAWIPVWAFGRRFDKGKNIERLPEQTLGILMGVFGSAFTASLAHFYQEIRLLLPSSALEKVDEILNAYHSTMSTFHPFSQARFANPFYRLSDDTSTTLYGTEEIDLVDAGCDNNIPFYPLLRKGRDVDLIIAFDLSADIETAPHLQRAEGYAKRRGIVGWPSGAVWPTSTDKLDTCAVFTTASSEEAVSDSQSAVEYPERINPITVAYFPLVKNEQYDADFDPQTAEFCSTWNFVYTSEQVSKLGGLAEKNWRDNLEKVKQAMKEIWETKRSLRHRK